MGKVKQEMLSDEDDDVPLSARKSALKQEPDAKAAGKRKQAEESSDEDVPLSKRKAVAVKKESVAESEDDDVPLSQRSKPEKKKANGAAKEPKKRKVETASPTKKKAKKEETTEQQGEGNGEAAEEEQGEEGEEGEENGDYKWWDYQKEDSTVKWKSLRHNGVYFAPAYVPHNVPFKYDGQVVALTPEQEEVASFYAQLIGTDWVQNPIFQNNFFRDFKEILGASSVVKDLSKCDFSEITAHFNALKEAKKSMTKEQKEEVKKEKKKLEDHYGWCYLNGRKEKVGNFRMEPPGLFRGRGKHPKAGTLKRRVQAEDVTINIGEGETVPEPPPGHRWKDVVHDNTVTWLATWTENVNGSIKYVFLAANSSLKGKSDMKKFEKARNLKNHIDSIRQEYTEELKSKEMVKRQRATAMYLIDKLALRAGNEKGEDEADTVGCCSLRLEHVELEAPSFLVLDFLGKDSIRYYNRVEVSPAVYKNIEIFRRPPKTPTDPLFDRLNTTILNKHLTSLMEGLSAKVFRTFNASFTFQQELANTPLDGSVAEKILAYRRANRQVAVLCNHQRAVSKAHQEQMQRLQDKLLALKYQRQQIKKQIMELAPTRKNDPEVADPESDLDDDFIERHLKEVAEKEREKKEKKRDPNDPDTAVDKSDGPSSPKKKPTLEQLEKQLVRISERITAARTQVIDKDENKTTALNTSKINYIDPRISAAWCYKYKVPIEKIFNPSLREKFKWALEVGEDYVF